MGPIATELTKIALAKLASVTAADVARAATVARNVGAVTAASAASAALFPSIAAFAVGAGVGVGVALLVAPRSGVETRRRLKAAASRVVSRVRGPRLFHAQPVNPN